MKIQGVLFAGLAFCFGVQSVQQGKTVDTITISTCAGTNVSFPWSFNSTSKDPAPQTMKWILEGNNSSTVLAIYHSDRVLFVSRDYVQRLHLAADTHSMTLAGISHQDSGNYSLQVSFPNSPESADVIVRQLLLTVKGLVSHDGDLHMEMGGSALWDTDTSQWMIAISCGPFSFSGQPPFGVVWITPGGDQLDSSHYAQGYFHLHLFSPVQGGRYTCRVPPQHFAAACVGLGGGSQGDGKLEDTMMVDDLKAGLLMLQADLQVVKDENRRLKDAQTRLQERSQELEENSTLQEEKSRHLEVTSTQLRQDVTDLRAADHLMRDEIGRNFSGSIAELRANINQLGIYVAFMSKIQTSKTLRGSSRIKFTDVQYNQGNAYLASTGEFTAPLSGLYCFFMKTESSINKVVRLDMKKESKRLLYLYAFDKSTYQTSSGSVVTHLNKGQRVWVDTSGSSSYVNRLTRFGGYLVRPDISV